MFTYNNQPFPYLPCNVTNDPKIELEDVPRPNLNEPNPLMAEQQGCAYRRKTLSDLMSNKVEFQHAAQCPSSELLIQF